MQRSGATPTQTSAPFFSSFFGGGGSTSISGSNSNSNSNSNHSSNTNNVSSSSPAKSRAATGFGEVASAAAVDSSSRQPNLLHKDRDRRPSFSRKASFGSLSSSSPSKGGKRRTSSLGAAVNGAGAGDNSIPPLPDFSRAAAAKLSRDTDALQSPASIDSFSKMLSRTAPTPVNGFTAAPGAQLAPPAAVAPGQPSELSVIHQHIHDTANKRISTLDYLRKA